MSAWLHAVPFDALGLEIAGATFMILMRLWLGIELVACNDDGSHLCPFCRQPAVAFGDHFLCCKQYEFHSRHTAVVDTLTHFIRAAGQRVANKVGVAGREHPADLFLERWCEGRAAAVDVTVIPPLAPRWAYLLKPPTAS